ncbi:MAG: alanine racemase, partial [Actinomycetota bacterium]
MDAWIPARRRATPSSTIATAAQETGRGTGVHIKVDTGMHRMGAQPSEV